jgi:hypothetical protein
LFLEGVLIAPALETLLPQDIPISIARISRVTFWRQVVTSTIIVAIPHFFADVGTGLGAGLVGGFYSAFTYAHWRNRSRWTAFWTTTASHALHNAIVLAILVAS